MELKTYSCQIQGGIQCCKLRKEKEVQTSKFVNIYQLKEINTKRNFC